MKIFESAIKQVCLKVGGLLVYAESPTARHGINHAHLQGQLPQRCCCTALLATKSRRMRDLGPRWTGGATPAGARSLQLAAHWTSPGARWRKEKPEKGRLRRRRREHRIHVAQGGSGPLQQLPTGETARSTGLAGRQGPFVPRLLGCSKSRALS